MYFAFPGSCSVSYLSLAYGRSLWAELNGGENSLHWKPNMLPLFSIMTLWAHLIGFSSLGHCPKSRLDSLRRPKISSFQASKWTLARAKNR